MRARTLILSAAVAVACGTALFLHLRGGGDEATPSSAAPQRREPRAEAPRPNVGAIARAPASAPVDKGGASLETDEAINAPVDPTPSPREEPLTAEERDPRMKRAVQMLDEALARTEARLAEAEAAGDTVAADTARIRIAKLKEVRDLRARELEAKP